MSSIVSTALTIAGSDCSGGAGVQADLKTFTALRVFGMSVITSLTAQNSLGVNGIIVPSAEFVGKQIDSVITDIGCETVKIGMLLNREIIEVVVEKIEEYDIQNVVVDPVMTAKSGDRLLEGSAVDSLIKRLIPKSLIITPNIPEAEIIIGRKIRTVEDMKEACKQFIKLGSKFVVIKGGHLEGSSFAVDVVYDGNEYFEYSSERIDTKNTHGTGCTYSAAITANLAKRKGVIESVGLAKYYVTEAIRNSFELGEGYGPLNHFWNI